MHYNQRSSTDMNKNKYVVFGGSFDPFTVAHKAIVTELFKKFGAYKVIIAPSFVNWYRKDKKPWMDFDQKSKAIHYILNNEDFRYDFQFWEGDFRLLSNCKSEDSKKLFEQRGFIDTLFDIKTYFRAGETDSQEWYFCVGSDQFEFFKNWKMWEEVLNQAKMIVINNRNGKFVESDIPHIDLQIDDQYQNASASEIREKYIAEGKTPADYIKWAHNTFHLDNTITALVSTPIFDVVRGPEADNGLKPIKINAPDWVSILVEREGMVLVEKQFRYGANDFIEEFPCGMVETGEDPLDAAVRELEEETGIKLLNKTQIVKLGQTNPNPAFMTNLMHYYYVDLNTAEYVQVDKHLDEHEKIDIRWEDRIQFIDKLANDAHACGKTQVPAIALSMVKLYETCAKHLKADMATLEKIDAIKQAQENEDDILEKLEMIISRTYDQCCEEVVKVRVDGDMLKVRYVYSMYDERGIDAVKIPVSWLDENFDYVAAYNNMLK
jgi:nicotinic acid mononucleotide adenylyltransferase/8-oxo-dGTP pyrophosphatase MutT (NUDIX family)